MVEETYRAAFMLHCSRVRSLAAAVNHVALKGDAVEAMRLVEELRVARSAKTLAQQELRAVKGAQPAGTAAPLMITAAAATDEDVWPVSSRPPPAVPEGIRRVALEEISAADVAECGCHFAPWYTPYFLAEQRVAARMQHAQTLEAQRLAQLRRDNDALQARVARLEALTAPEGPLIKEAWLMLYAGAWRAFEAEMWALLEDKGLLDGLLQRIVELEQRPRGMTYHGIWGQMREYPGGAVTTRNGVARIAMQPAHAVEQPGAGGPWKAILKSDEALLRQLLRDECGRDPRRMNEQALTLDQFMEAIRPELEREVDEMILVQPAHARALLMARREQILREYTGAVRIANLEHRNRELEAPLPPRLVE